MRKKILNWWSVNKSLTKIQTKEIHYSTDHNDLFYQHLLPYLLDKQWEDEVQTLLLFLVLSLVLLLVFLISLLFLSKSGSLTEAAKKRVRQGLCLSASNLGRQRVDCLINFAVLYKIRAVPTGVRWIPSLLIRLDFPQKVSQLDLKATLLSGHHHDNQWSSNDMRLNM